MTCVVLFAFRSDSYWVAWTPQYSWEDGGPSILEASSTQPLASHPCGYIKRDSFVLTSCDTKMLKYVCEKEQLGQCL